MSAGAFGKSGVVCGLKTSEVEFSVKNVLARMLDLTRSFQIQVIASRV